MIDDARRLELLAGGPDIDRGRCDEILALAAAQGIVIGVDQATDMGCEILRAFEVESSDAAA
jgi:hydroxyethylthiazole kinase-like sugar kinase family protein